MAASATKIVNKLLRAAEEDVLPSGQDVPPGQFVDLATFFVAVRAYKMVKGEDDPHLKSVTSLLNRYQDDLVAGARKYLLPLGEEASFTRFRSILHRGLRPTRGIAQAEVQAEMLSDILEVLHSHPNVLRETFSDSRAITTALRVGAIVSNDAPASILNGLASVPPASRLQVTKKWVQKAAEIAGVAPSEIESVLSDVSTAQMIGSEIHAVEAQIAGTDPVSPEAADLHAQKGKLLEDLGEVVAGSKNPGVVLSTAATVAAQPTEYATKTAKAQRLSPDQERAMMTRGKAIIAAGAGSGKTATLASKVAYHVNELGVPPGAIIATSFSRKSAAELRRRIEKYGAEIPNSAETGFGTTHSIAGKLMREYGGGGRDGLKSYEQSNLVRLAMEQVQMDGPGTPPPEAKSLFADLTPKAPSDNATPSPAQDGPGLTFKKACELAYQRRSSIGNAYLRSFIESYFNPRDKWYNLTMRTTNHLQDPRGLSEKQVNILRDIFDMTGVDYSPDRDPGLMSPTSRMAAKDKDKGLREKFTYFSKPAGQWFNLGLELTEEGPDGQKKPIPSGVFKQAITKFKGKAISPSEAWQLTGGSPEAAVYAAYEWLKGPTGEVDFQGRGDFDDILLDVSKMLLSNPRVLRQVQSRFKVVLVDEAQDLNRAQHLMFGLISGFIDQAKVTNVANAKRVGELAKDDGSITADTYVFIGDDKQCVACDTLVSLPDGRTKRAANLKPGDQVLSYRNGEIMAQTVRHVVPSSWTWGYEVTTESGNTLRMSPNHKLWATEPLMGDDEHLVYLMHRRDLGFRVGVTGMGRDDDHMYLFGQRPVGEKAEKFWVLDVCADREDALTLESTYSLQYGIPTLVYHAEGRKMKATLNGRIKSIFAMFGANGSRLLDDRNLSFDLPHWIARTFTKEGRYTIQMVAHGPKGTQVSLEVKPDVDLGDFAYKESDTGTRVIRKFFLNYREALLFAGALQQQTGALLARHLSSPAGSLREITASGLFASMELPCYSDGAVGMDRIVSVKKIEDSFVDLDVDDASNFVASNLIVSNSIYEFRGADPEAFIDMSDLVDGGAGFKTEVLKTNYRSGELIVEAANRLIKYNSKQIPMTCKANPQRVDRGGIDVVKFAPVEGRDMKVPAEWLAAQIAEDIEEGRAGKKGYDAYGVGLRSNAEAYTYGLEMLKKGIPFRSKANFFNDPNTKALLHWLTIADEGLTGDADRVNAAVLGARGAPATKLGAAFEEKLTQMATGNYLAWLRTNWGRVYGTGGSWGDLVRTYTENLLKVAGLKGEPAEVVLASVLELQGFDGRSVKDVLLDKVRDDEEALAEIRAESATGTVSEEDIAEVAFAPLAPLKGLLSARPDLTEAMKYTRQLQAANMKLTAVDDPEAKGVNEPAVTLGTMHSWKGLEVENMYLPLVGGRFPRADATEEERASERRLAYVAVTRGENHVVVMNIPSVRKTKQGTTVQESQFVGELCVPPSTVSDGAEMWDAEAEAEVLENEEANARVASESPQDEDAMDAYLQGRE